MNAVSLPGTIRMRNDQHSLSCEFVRGHTPAKLEFEDAKKGLSQNVYVGNDLCVIPLKSGKYANRNVTLAVPNE